MSLGTLPPYIKPRQHLKRSEDGVHLRICTYLRITYPNIIFFSDAAGVNMSDSQRITMMKMRSENGVPDLIIDSPGRGYHGMRLELKQEGTVIYKKDGSLRKQPYTRRFKNGIVKRGDHLQEQADLLMKYNKMGYFARFAVGFDAAKKMIDWYFENEQQSLF